MRALVAQLWVVMLLLLTTPLFAQQKELSDLDIQKAIQYGSTRKPSWGCGDSPPCLKIGLSLDAGFGQRDQIRAYVFTPIEWLKWQGYLNTKALKPAYIPTQEDVTPVLRVITLGFRPETQYTSGRCDQTSNIVLRDTKKTAAVQPLSFVPVVETYQNGFGAEMRCVAATATFGLDQLEVVRRLDQGREFLVSVATGTAEGTKDWRIKKSDFARLP